MKLIERALELCITFLRVTIGVLVGLLTIPVGMQVISRYTGVLPVYLWTEELATFIFVWIVMLGSMLAVWDRTHFDVHVLPEAVSPRGRLLQQGFVHLAVTAFAVLFIWYGIGYTQFGSIQNSVMLRMNMALTYVTVPVAGVGWALFSLRHLACEIAIYRQHRRSAQ
ncbi:TRAP-type C4-dicarboxylate transport system permease small subunit [Aliiruegeria haliotis]|uniref:TRAP transporter small permease protein n=1 Tax=Aliiruegeria haliotis TaxID=1280846 RepID=A0A2T0RZD2_9RHOB|nr:TRAP transporter small permease [Aliiruegeria haliotis]PRY26544.1 TRAP-type C4-dicarboxylate transport system permease small subunit [Aliiruegeria haliotis]